MRSLRLSLAATVVLTACARGVWRRPIDVRAPHRRRRLGRNPSPVGGLRRRQLMLPLLLLALLARPQTPSPEPKLFEFGQLRHVQLLQPRGDVVRFAKQIEVGTIENHWPEGIESRVAVFEGEDAEPVAELAVGYSLIQGFTWTVRPAWCLVEVGEATMLAVLELTDPPVYGRRLGNGLRVLSFADGEELLRIAGVQGIEDCLVRGGDADLVVRREGQVLWIRASERGEVAHAATIDLGLDRVACAAFVRGGVTEEPRAWAIGWKEKDLFAVPFGPTGAARERAFRLSFDGGPGNDVVDVGESLRVTAWACEPSAHLAVSWQGYRNTVGRIQVLDVSTDPKALWDGRPDPEIDESHSLDGREYGQAIAFVPDADEDGVPDLLVTGPWECADPSVDLLSGRSGSRVKSWTPGTFACTGHSLSLSADGRHALVGGTDEQGYPEMLSKEGQAHLLDVARMQRLRTWSLSARSR